MITEGVVELSRWQFAVTALYHFLFVPLTLGLSFLLAIMESCYVMTGRQVYKDMTQFWGKLFGINFALGVATGLTMEFQFGMNWAYFSHYVGDVFGAPLAIEGLMAFFLESSFVGLFFFGWDKLSKGQHLMVTWLVALGTNLSALWILIANGWMQNPVGAEFNLETMRMEVSSFGQLIFNPAAQVKFVHTVAAGYTTASAFVLGISAFYMLKGRDAAFSQRSYTIAAGFGLAAVLAVIVLGDESGYTDGEVQKAKLAAIEAEWETEEPPAAFTLVGIPDQEAMETKYAIKIPWVLGLIGTRSIDTPIMGLKDILLKNEQRIRNGMKAYAALQKIKDSEKPIAPELVAEFEQYKADLGYGLLLKRWVDDVSKATEAQIAEAVQFSIPRVVPLFWTFRVMVACGFIMLVIFALAFAMSSIRKCRQEWLLKLSFWMIPLPWIACEMGWFVAEFGRQPWTIAEILPTFLSASSLTEWDIILSLSTYILAYTCFLMIEMFLMLKFIRLGPSSLHTGRYHFEIAEGAVK
ncbi:cytochrome ubiquinol oxidase subunit I [methane-oxidizing endosymbiont of Gigantopelta aegis]|uniref:cytochrome ubiquinol oxidase subunit I n=1 Tax=methane-oxidizing endosymbiont of Gigantopelta aegis TaxID=2794938 RepID=UPI0018DEA6AE|nr:cytochrome ubiquinol oxidase subunit I [methane-oxidizing endosymbiont of Gigantopelta aegis]